MRCGRLEAARRRRRPCVDMVKPGNGVRRPVLRRNPNGRGDLGAFRCRAPSMSLCVVAIPPSSHPCHLELPPEALRRRHRLRLAVRPPFRADSTRRSAAGHHLVAAAGVRMGALRARWLGERRLHTAYYMLLDRGYRSGDLSVVYPLARGTGPLITDAVRRPAPARTAGRPRRRRGASHRGRRFPADGRPP